LPPSKDGSTDPRILNLVPIARRWGRGSLPGSLFDPLTKTGPLARIGPTMAYDPVNERVVIFGGLVLTPQDAGARVTDDVWACKVASNTWAELVPSPQ
jgi:hypothetical protein